jgi:hypothetical protein
VRDYVSKWTKGCPDRPGEILIDPACPTKGPHGRYRFALFVEKEGFHPLLEQALIANRYDLAIMSTKGMSVTASRRLVERLSEEGVTVLVLRDFDKSGFSIVHTLRTSNRRYSFKTEPNVIDLGLRLTQVRDMGLKSETVVYKKGDADPRVNLLESGATEEEGDFLVSKKSPSNRWSGERVELNAMTSDQFLSFLKGRLEEVGAARKVVPGKQDLTNAYRRACILAQVQEAIEEAIRQSEGFEPPPVSGLEKVIRKKIEGKAIPWDVAVWQLACEQLRKPAVNACLSSLTRQLGEKTTTNNVTEKRDPLDRLGESLSDWLARLEAMEFEDKKLDFKRAFLADKIREKIERNKPDDLPIIAP